MSKDRNLSPIDYGALTPEQAENLVKNGSGLLQRVVDEHFFLRIDVSVLNMHSNDKCILGQLGVGTLGLSEATMYICGFGVREAHLHDAGVLRDAWIRKLQELVDAL